MKIVYQFAANEVDIHEKRDGEDTEFHIRIFDKNKHVDSIHEVRDFFNRNNIHTDVIFHSNSVDDHIVIVRKDYYAEFVACLFTHKLLTLVEWK